MKIPTILKGDDARAITLSLDASHSYLNAVLVVAYQGVTKTFAGLSAGGSVSLVYSHDETAKFALGCYPLEARLLGPGGSVETVSNAEWRIKVTDILAEVNCGGSFAVDPGAAPVPVTEIDEVGERYKLADLAAKVNEICRILAQKTSLALVFALAALGASAASVQTARIDEVYNDAQVVTNVTFDAAPDFTTNNVELTNTIAKVAPAPGDYANVSNAAMFAANRVDRLRLIALDDDGCVTGATFRVGADIVIETTAANRVAFENADAHVWLSAHDGSDANDGLSPTSAVKTIMGAYNAAYCAATNGTLNASNEIVVAVAEGRYAPCVIYSELTNGIAYVATGDRKDTIIDGMMASRGNPWSWASGRIEGERMACANGVMFVDAPGRPFSMHGFTLTGFNQSYSKEVAGYCLTRGIRFVKCDITGNNPMARGGVFSGVFEDCDIHGNVVPPYMTSTGQEEQDAVFGGWGTKKDHASLLRCHVWDNDFSTCGQLFYESGHCYAERCLLEVDWYESNGSLYGGRNTIIAKTVSNPNIEGISHSNTKAGFSIGVTASGIAYGGTNLIVVASPGPGYNTGIYGVGYRSAYGGWNCIVSNANLAADFTAADPSCPAVRNDGQPDYGYRDSGLWQYKSIKSWAKTSSKPSYNFSEIKSRPTTLSGYGITDAKIEDGTITLGGTTLTPLTEYKVPGATDGNLASLDGQGNLADSGIAKTNVATVADLAGLGLKPIEISGAAASNGVTFCCDSTNKAGVVCGEVQNAAIEVGEGARAKIADGYIDGLTTNAVLRSVSIAIGGKADALVENSKKSQAIAIGWHARAKGSNAIAIGMGAEHAFENAAVGTGDATYAKMDEAIAIGYSAWATNSGAVAIGGRAKAYGERAVQIGQGVNTTKGSLQFRDWQLLDGSGQIPTARLTTAYTALTNGVVEEVEQKVGQMLGQSIGRTVRPGNMTVVADGTNEDEGEMQVVEPRLDGLSELLIRPNTNEYFMADTSIAVAPPLGSRNYDLLVREIPQSVYITNGLPVQVGEEANFHLFFGELKQTHAVTLWCDPSLGYTNGLQVVITNAPCVVKVREPATNRLCAVVKPWSILDL